MKTHQPSSPLVVISMGDPAGIGPEVCLKLLAIPSVLEKCQPILYGDWGVLQRVAAHCGLPLAARATIGAGETAGLA